MALFRISIASLMALILYIALVLTALRFASDASADFARYLTVAALVTATYQARYRVGRQGAWWFGFALAGWAYYLLSVDVMPNWSRPVHYKNSLVHDLPYRLLNLVVRDVDLDYLSRSPKDIRYENIARTIQSILIIIFAVAGGLICSVVGAGRRPGDHPRA